MDRRRTFAAAAIVAAFALPASPALAQDDCVEPADGSAAGQQGEDPCGEVLDDSLEKPDQAAPDVDSLAATGAPAGLLLAGAAGAVAIGGGALTVTRRRRAGD